MTKLFQNKPFTFFVKFDIIPLLKLGCNEVYSRKFHELKQVFYQKAFLSNSNINHLSLQNLRFVGALVGPLVPINTTKSYTFLYAFLAQLDRALVYGTKGQGFESLRTHQIVGNNADFFINNILL